MRAARAARLYFHIQPIIRLFSKWLAGDIATSSSGRVLATQVRSRSHSCTCKKVIKDDNLYLNRNRRGFLSRDEREVFFFLPRQVPFFKLVTIRSRLWNELALKTSRLSEAMVSKFSMFTFFPIPRAITRTPLSFSGWAACAKIWSTLSFESSFFDCSPSVITRATWCTNQSNGSVLVINPLANHHLLSFRGAWSIYQRLMDLRADVLPLNKGWTCLRWP